MCQGKGLKMINALWILFHAKDRILIESFGFLSVFDCCTRVYNTRVTANFCSRSRPPLYSNKDGKTALIYASSSLGLTDMVKLLLAAGAEIEATTPVSHSCTSCESFIPRKLYSWE